MKLKLKLQCMFSVLHSQYHACWCTGDFRSQCISRHDIDPQCRYIPSSASEELFWNWLNSILKTRITPQIQNGDLPHGRMEGNAIPIRSKYILTSITNTLPPWSDDYNMSKHMDLISQLWIWWIILVMGNTYEITNEWRLLSLNSRCAKVT